MRQLPRRRPSSSRETCWPQLRLHELFVLLGLVFFIAGLVYITPLVESQSSAHSWQVTTTRGSSRRFGGLLRPRRSKPAQQAPTFLKALDGLLDDRPSEPLPEQIEHENVAGTPLPWQRWRPVAWQTETGPPEGLVAPGGVPGNRKQQAGWEKDRLAGLHNDSSAASRGGPDRDGMAVSANGTGSGSAFEREVQAGGKAGDRIDQSAFCDLHFGMGWLQAWNATGKDVCSRPGDGVTSTVRCRSMQDSHMPNASAPHVLCDATNLVLDKWRMHPARCPKHREGYLCKSRTYHRYDKGAFAAACDWPGMELAQFPRDHLRDIADAFELLPAENLPEVHNSMEVDAIDATPTLLVTREVEEHANVFHTLTDLLNVYISLQMLGWQRECHQVVLLDNHPAGPLDPLWAAVAAGGGVEALAAPWNATRKGKQRLLRRVADLPQRTLLEQAVFVPPGYISLLFAHLYEANSCPQHTALFAGFRSFVLAPLGLFPVPRFLDRPLKVTIISRQPFVDPTTKRRKKVVRRISNEPALLAMMQTLEDVDAALVDFAALGILQQLQLISETDILIGMHGAALAYSLLMQEHAALLEFWPTVDGIWRCYEHTAEWAGLLYRRWANPEPAHLRREADGSDATEVDLEAVKSLISSLVVQVRARKQRAGTAP